MEQKSKHINHRDYTGGKRRIECEASREFEEGEISSLCMLEDYTVLVEWSTFLDRNEWTHCSSVRTLSDQCNSLSIINCVGGNYLVIALRACVPASQLFLCFLLLVTSCYTGYIIRIDVTLYIGVRAYTHLHI